MCLRRSPSVAAINSTCLIKPSSETFIDDKTGRLLFTQTGSQVVIISPWSLSLFTFPFKPRLQKYTSDNTYNKGVYISRRNKWTFRCPSVMFHLKKRRGTERMTLGKRQLICSRLAKTFDPLIDFSQSAFSHAPNCVLNVLFVEVKWPVVFVYVFLALVIYY